MVDQAYNSAPELQTRNCRSHSRKRNGCGNYVLESDKSRMDAMDTEARDIASYDLHTSPFLYIRVPHIRAEDASNGDGAIRQSRKLQGESNHV